MSRFPRFAPGASMQMITIRTIGGRHLFRPVPALTRAVLGALGRALELYPVQLHAFIFLSNHAHLLITIMRAWLMSSFLRQLNKSTGDVARAINGITGPVWGRAHNAAVLDDAAAIEQLQYIFSNCVKEGLVDDPREWPGPSSASALLEGTPLRGRWQSRTLPSQRTAASAVDKEYVIRLAPLPCWEPLTAEQQRSRMRELAENAIGMARRDRGDRPVLGVKGVLSTDPLATHELMTKKRAPIAHASSTTALIAYRDQRREWGNDFRSASAEFRKDGPPQAFPVESFPPAPIATPPGDPRPEVPCTFRRR